MSDKDKKAAIRDCAKELFSARGFKETNVSDITKQASIATGTFYLYYTSKEQLFMELFQAENVKLKREILASTDLEGEPLDVVKEILARNAKGIGANPILREWYNKDVFNKIEQHFREENGLEHFDFLYDVFVEIVAKWQAEGKMRKDIDPGMIMAIFGALINIDTHKAEIGLQYFPRIVDYMTEFVLKGLTEHRTK